MWKIRWEKFVWETHCGEIQYVVPISAWRVHHFVFSPLECIIPQVQVSSASTTPRALSLLVAKWPHGRSLIPCSILASPFFVSVPRASAVSGVLRNHRPQRDAAYAASAPHSAPMVAILSAASARRPTIISAASTPCLQETTSQSTTQVQAPRHCIAAIVQ